mmetsp:Transcript_90919/g.190108  ORF Transcript_90919/g.190108 Transcript_90919/m.190108 type:complete len:363 (+) Transcript_90919:631-1719(+)
MLGFTHLRCDDGHGVESVDVGGNIEFFHLVVQSNGAGEILCIRAALDEDVEGVDIRVHTIRDHVVEPRFCFTLPRGRDKGLQNEVVRPHGWPQPSRFQTLKPFDGLRAVLLHSEARDDAVERCFLRHQPKVPLHAGYPRNCLLQVSGLHEATEDGIQSNDIHLQAEAGHLVHPKSSLLSIACASAGCNHRSEGPDVWVLPSGQHLLHPVSGTVHISSIGASGNGNVVSDDVGLNLHIDHLVDNKVDGGGIPKARATVQGRIAGRDLKLHARGQYPVEAGEGLLGLPGSGVSIDQGRPADDVGLQLPREHVREDVFGFLRFACFGTFVQFAAALEHLIADQAAASWQAGRPPALSVRFVLPIQ